MNTLHLVELPEQHRDQWLPAAVASGFSAMYNLSTDDYPEHAAQWMAMWDDDADRDGWRGVGLVLTVNASATPCSCPALHPVSGAAALPMAQGMIDPHNRLPRRAQTWLPSCPSTSADSVHLLVGFACGYTGSNQQTQHHELLTGLRGQHRSIELARGLTNYFHATELHLHPLLQGYGLGSALAHAVLAGLTHDQVLCLVLEHDVDHSDPVAAEIGITPAASPRAWRLYTDMGFTPILCNHTMAASSTPVAFLVADLPIAP